MAKQKMRVWWNPQLGEIEESFYIPVETIEEAKKIMDVLAYYDCYQMNKGIKDDYCNCGGLEVWNEEEQDWNDWYYEDEDNYFDDVDDYVDVMSDQKEVLEAALIEMGKQVSFS